MTMLTLRPELHQLRGSEPDWDCDDELMLDPVPSGLSAVCDLTAKAG